MSKVYIPTPFRDLTGGLGHLEATGATISELIADLDRRYPGLALRIASGGFVHHHVNVFVNGREVRELQNEETPLGPADEVAFIPALIGGGLHSRGSEDRFVIEITAPQRDSMIHHARLLREREECCGFLVGQGDRVSRVIWMENQEHSALNYRVDPLIYQLIQDGLDRQRDQGYQDDIIGFYHSHTHSEAWPSRTDIEIARPNWAGYHQIIISLKDPETPVLRSFVIDRDGEVTPEEVLLR